jgi:hypothetical protein
MSPTSLPSIHREYLESVLNVVDINSHFLSSSTYSTPPMSSSATLCFSDRLSRAWRREKLPSLHHAHCKCCSWHIPHTLMPTRRFLPRELWCHDSTTSSLYLHLPQVHIRDSCIYATKPAFGRQLDCACLSFRTQNVVARQEQLPAIIQQEGCWLCNWPLLTSVLCPGKRKAAY